MGPHHLERAEALGGTGKSYLLTGYPAPGADGRAIADPMGGELEAYRTAADELEVEIRRVFEQNYRCYGARRVFKQLAREGHVVARCTVARLMGDMGLRGRATRQEALHDRRR